jgi:hypothetical protein
MQNYWICSDFKTPRVIPTYYAFRSFFLSSRLIESSIDGENWIYRRENSPGAPDTRIVQMFQVVRCERCRYVQLVNIGVNEFGADRLDISAWEIFGHTHRVGA